MRAPQSPLKNLRIMLRATLSIWALLLACDAPASAATYTVFDAPNALQTSPAAMNNKQQIGGFFEYRVGNGVHYQGFIREPDGTFVTIDVGNLGRSFVYGMNDKGWVVGEYDDGQDSLGFIRKPGGSIVKLDTAIPLAINNSETICGYEANQAFVRTKDGTVTLFEAGGVRSQAYAINDAGTVAGVFDDGKHNHGFVRTADGVITTFDVPGVQSTDIAGINAGGSVVGTYYDGHYHGFIRDASGTLTLFNGSNAPDTEADSINDKGEVVGYFGRFTGPHGRSHSFLRKVNGDIVRFDPPGGEKTSYADRINRHGDIVGEFGPNNGQHAYLRTRP